MTLKLRNAAVENADAKKDTKGTRKGAVLNHQVIINKKKTDFTPVLSKKKMINV